MESPFDVWLNEAFTVDVERRFMADLFDPSFMRLQQVESIRSPLLGPLTIEDSGHAGRIIREGFNDPDELIDGVTYVKAAEVIRMLCLLLGEERFRAGKTLYFTRYRHGNANTDQFFQCFEEACGCSLELFKKSWLTTIGYPKIVATTVFDPDTMSCRVRFRREQGTEGSLFHFPIRLALVDDNGADIPGTDQVFEMKEAEAELVIADLSRPPAFASINRDYSFYGTFRHENAGPEVLRRQALLDPNAYNRVDAMRKLTDVQRIRLMLDPGAEIDEEWLSLYGAVLCDQRPSSALRAYLLRIDEQPMDRAYCTWYVEQVTAREKIMAAVNRAYRPVLLDQFLGIDTYSLEKRRNPWDGIEDRMLKNVLLDLITVDDSPHSHRLILDHYRAATTANDRVTALAALNRTSFPERRSVLEEAYASWHTHLSAYANYLRVVAGGTREDVFEMIAREKARPSFVITQPTWCRALFLPMAANNKMLWTERGVRWLADTVVELAPINATITGRLLNAFQHVDRLKPEWKEKVLSELERIVQLVTEDAGPSIHGQARAYWKGAARP